MGREIVSVLFHEFVWPSRLSSSHQVLQSIQRFSEKLIEEHFLFPLYFKNNYAFCSVHLASERREKGKECCGLRGRGADGMGGEGVALTCCCSCFSLSSSTVSRAVSMSLSRSPTELACSSSLFSTPKCSAAQRGEEQRREEQEDVDEGGIEEQRQ
jgi:hypothetical protein